MSIETLLDIARVEARYVLLIALYYVLVVYPIIWYRRRRPK